eukprot:GHRQ01021371.1.p2 GENE.GHRQ01021371.1~~GHRQ01021371.1.p2  ORF type:complete len:117 (+),score=7.31 GHRQ01021371.1:342-692(+)
MLKAQLRFPRTIQRCTTPLAPTAVHTASSMHAPTDRVVLHESVVVHKPRCDKRQYQHADLPNGVRVLVIQDLDAVYAAASANVQMGYFGDPEGLPGQPAVLGMHLNFTMVQKALIC